MPTAFVGLYLDPTIATRHDQELFGFTHLAELCMHVLEWHVETPCMGNPPALQRKKVKIDGASKCGRTARAPAIRCVYLKRSS
jgi:hypothetical protein